MPIAYVTPFENRENPYVALQKGFLSSLGFELRPLSIAALLSGRCSGLWSARNVVFVSWLENRVFELGTEERGLSAFGAAMFAFYAGVLASARARVVFVVHDHAVHDVRARYVPLSKALIGLLRKIADDRVVHDPSFAAHYDATYLPHPLYDEAKLASAAERVGQGPVRFGIMGSIRPYKGIDRVLRVWPHGVELSILGNGPPEYVAELAEIVAERGLTASVHVTNRLLSDAEFIDQMSALDVLILPHLPATMLVSGSFFAAAGRVGCVLARRSPFLTWASARIPGIALFDSDRELPELVRALAETPSRGARDLARRAAQQAFGREVCEAAYADFLSARSRPS